MNINIYTFQNAINIGAYLQAFALKKVVEDIGSEVSFPYRFSVWNQKYDIIAKKPQKLFFNFKRYIKFIKAQKVFNGSIKNNADISIIGSDSIWDVTEKTSGYIPEMFGINTNSNKTITYAASFGTLTDKDAIPEKGRVSLMNLDGISVRDLNSKRIINDMGMQCEIVLDPTLLYDFKDIEESVNEEDYILIYGTFPEKYISQLIELKEKLGRKMISVGTYNNWCDKSIPVSPGEFIGYVKNATFIVTSMYHGSIFAMKNHKKFISYFTEKRLTKALTTFETLGMKDRIFGDNLTESLETLLNKEIDYDMFEVRLSEAKEESISYLRKFIKE